MPRMIVWIIPGFFVLELYVLVMVASHVGVLATMGLLLLSCAAGMLLLRVYGLSMSMKMRQDLMQGVLPENPLINGLCLTAAAFLFMFPGFVSDFIAVLLLLPAVRRWLLALLLSRMGDGRGGATVHTQTGYMDEQGRMVWRDSSDESWREPGPQDPQSKGSVIIDCDAKDVTKQDKKE